MLTYGKWAHDAVGIMILLAEAVRTGELALSGTELARRLNMGAALVAKQMRVLTRAGLVTARRGLHGGYRLARPADRITLLDVVAVFATHRASEGCPHCQPPYRCPIRESLRAVNAVSVDRLNALTLQQCLDSMRCGAAGRPDCLADVQELE